MMGSIAKRGGGIAAVLGLFGLLALAVSWSGIASAGPEIWKYEWSQTDFSKTSVDFREIFSGGPPKDGIPAIDDPQFVAVADSDGLADTEPVIGLVLNGEKRAYPLSILIWHEIVNDEVGGVPVSVTYCPLCNAAVVFDRRVDGRVLDFGTTGKLRRSDLVMYDRQTESWWQQFTGTGIVGAMTGVELKIVPARLESWAKFKARAPDGQVLVPNFAGARAYGRSPYGGYDYSERPFLYRGDLPSNVPPMERVVTVNKRAWAISLVKAKRRVETEDGLVITWEAGQNSAMSHSRIAEGDDVGNVLVQRMENGALVDVAYGVDYAFAYHAFYPDRPIIAE